MNRIIYLSIFFTVIFTHINVLYSKNTSYNSPADICYLIIGKDSCIFKDKRKYLPVYLNDYKLKFLGWFYFSNREILYLSSEYKSEDLVFKQANDKQVLFNRKKKWNKNEIFYMDIFSHINLSLVKEDINSYYLISQNILPPPSHANLLKEIEISKDLKTIKFKVYFRGEIQPHICILKVPAVLGCSSK